MPGKYKNWYDDVIKKDPRFESCKSISDVNLLYPEFTFLILKLFTVAYSTGLKIFIKETYRSQARQLELFEKGYTQLKQNGMHHFGVAADLSFYKNKKSEPIKEIEWQKLGKIGKNLGLYWGGDWITFKDCSHLQLIPATVEAQTKIIEGKYPRLGKTSLNLQKILPFYEAVQKDNYSAKSIENLISIAKKLYFPVDKKLYN